MLHHFTKAIGRDDVVQFHQSMVAFRAAHAKELPTLDELLNLTSNETAMAESAFDAITEDVLEREALKNLEERRRAASGK